MTTKQQQRLHDDLGAWRQHLAVPDTTPVQVMAAPRHASERASVVGIIDALTRLIALRDGRSFTMSIEERERRREHGRWLGRLMADRRASTVADADSKEES